jgi:hypothetical protein
VIDRVAVPVTVAAAVVAAVIAGLADADPTALAGVNVVLRVALAVAMVLAAARATPVPLVGASVVAVTASVAGGPLIAAGAALVLAVVFAVWARPMVMDQWSPFGASCGLALSVVVLRLEWPDRTGATAFVATVIAVVVLVAGWWELAPPWRRRAAWLATALGGLTIVLGASATIAVLRARSDLEAAVDEARAGLDAIDDLSQRDAALAQLRSARLDFASANSTLDAWWVKPALVVPVLSQHVDVVQTLSDSGERLAASSAAALETADPDRLRVTDGSIDLTALSDVSGALQRAVGDLRTTRADLDDLQSPWLVHRVQRQRDDLAARIDDALEPASNAADGAEVAVSMLGADGPKRYLLMMVTNSESRAIGGWYGSYAIVDANGGDLSLEHVGRTGDELLRVPPPEVDAPDDYVDRYAFAYSGPGDVRTMPLTPDFSVAADLLVQAFGKDDPVGVDGVIAVDAYGLAALLQLTGPVTVPSWPDPISADNVVQVLLLDQYAQQPATSERGEFQGEVADAVWAKLTAGDLAAADELIDVLSPAVRGRRIQVYATDTDAEAFLARVDAAGVMAPLRGDYLGVVTQNFGGNKIDWFLRREISYDVDYDPESRRASGTIRVTLRNDAPVSGLSPLVIGSIEGLTTEPGVNRTWFNVYTALRVRSATVDGEPLVLTEDTELGRRVYATELVLAPGSTTVVELRVDGELTRTTSDDAYRLDVLGQPVVGNDQLAITVNGATLRAAAPQDGSVEITTDGR